MRLPERVSTSLCSPSEKYPSVSAASNMDESFPVSDRSADARSSRQLKLRPRDLAWRDTRSRGTPLCRMVPVSGMVRPGLKAGAGDELVLKLDPVPAATPFLERMLSHRS